MLGLGPPYFLLASWSAFPKAFGVPETYISRVVSGSVFVKLVFAFLLAPADQIDQTTIPNGRYVVLTVGKA
jgi:hypothetical protein